MDAMRGALILVAIGALQPLGCASSSPPASAPVHSPPPRVISPPSASTEAEPDDGDCPPDTHWFEGRCVARDFDCPSGSERVGDHCVGRVDCPDGTDWNGATCEPSTDAPPQDVAGTCQLDVNSIPVTQVLIDGRVVGPTPRIGVRLSVGQHTVVFVHPERGRKVRTVGCAAGQRKTVAVKFER